jgi:hypothetical protein
VADVDVLEVGGREPPTGRRRLRVAGFVVAGLVLGGWSCTAR